MTDLSERTRHWETVYSTKSDKDVSWFEENPVISLEVIDAAWGSAPASVLDIGGGASRLVDALLARPGCRVTVLDLSKSALEAARARIGENADAVDWVVADVTDWQPQKTYDIWHDRAALHFLTQPEERAAYVRTLSAALRVGGIAVIGTFAPDGPEKCSGLPVMRHDAESLAQMLGDGLSLLDSRRHEHLTPWGSIQKFQFSTFKRLY
ncbi:class I SAM-dependent methyltransferase [Rhizobium sp. KVB221]|uniref:Class I SAM-dependent methyltransferase n=1 Tax=Rhizobium setariae TaxID=2801340 RepID=A0A937CPU0_9HYPH|nr:class I SAM-dependent methyltransferase [Rhizobium setariae]MBL0372968.1 class I SAM-dependent methyltransferase [Rhizobium setariae]